MFLSEHFKGELCRLAGPHYQERTYVLAVSGGVDSMVLLELFRREIPNAHLTVAHFNHGLRGKSSQLDEALVRQRCGESAITLQVGSPGHCESVAEGEVDKNASTSRMPSEDALREERRAFFRSVQQHTRADFIVTAHHGNDQLETLVMRLIRGTGAKGLSGIRPRRGPYLRPLLGVSGKRIREWARAEQIPFREDESNHSSLYFRNRVRKRAVPALLSLAETHGSEERLFRRLGSLTDELAEISHYFEDLAHEDFLLHGKETDLWLRFDREKFETLSPLRQRFLLRWIAQRMRVAVPNRDRLECVRNDIQKGLSNTNLGGGIEIKHSCGVLFFQTQAQRRLARSPILFEKRGKRWECGALGLSVKLDFRSEKPWIMRCAQPGDRFNGKKLKHLYLEQRIPAPERALLPVVTTDARCEEVQWFFPLSSQEVTIERLTFPFSFLK